jgi:hypothetical protein
MIAIPANYLDASRFYDNNPAAQAPAPNSFRRAKRLSALDAYSDICDFYIVFKLESEDIS